MKKQTKNILTYISIFSIIVVLYIAAFNITYAAELTKVNKSLDINKDISVLTKNALIEKWEASEYIINNCQWDNGCYYCDFIIGKWTNNHREITCDQTVNTENAIKSNLKWTLNEITKTDIPQEKIIDTTEYKEQLH